MTIRRLTDRFTLPGGRSFVRESREVSASSWRLSVFAPGRLHQYDRAVIRSVKVSVAGQTLTIRTDARKAYVQDLADYVTAKLDEVRQSGRTVSTQTLALLAAMSIADELHQERESTRQLKRDVRRRAQRIGQLLDEEETS